MTTPFTWDLPSDVLELSDFQLGWRMDAPEGATATAMTRVQDFDTAVLISRVRGKTDRPGFVVGLKPIEWTLTKAIPALDHPVLDAFTLDNLALIIADQDVRVGSAVLADAAREFYAKVYSADEFELVLTPGLNLIAAFPAERLGPDHFLNRLFERLGITSGAVLIQGTLGRSLVSLGKGGGGLDAIKDLYLRASLPKMRPPESPAWFKSGQLALELTGQPSIGFVGEITVDMEGEVLVFSITAKIAKDGMGAAVALVGGLKTEEPWVHPFGLEWLVFYKTILKLSVDMKANIGVGFAAQMIIGEKDIDLTVGVKVNASGVITNFLFDGESAAGVSMADLVALQAEMRKTKGALPGSARPPGIALDQLPPMEIKDIHVKFVLRDDPDLEVEQGFALKGELFVQMRPQGEMTNFAGVDFSVDDTGIVGKAHLGAYAIGPVSWDDALLDLELRMARQNLTISGSVDLGFARQHLDVSVTRAGASFKTDVMLVDRFRAKLDAAAPFTAHDPVWSVTGEMDNDFNGELSQVALAHLRAWADDHERAMAAARAANEAAQRLAEEAAQRLAALEASLTDRQSRARNAMDSADRAEAAAARAVDRAETTLGRAQNELEATPPRQVKRTVERKAAVVKAQAELAARKAALAAKRVEYAAKKAIFDGLSSDAVEALEREVKEARAAARSAAQRLRDMEALVASIRSGRGTPVVIERATFQGRLDTIRGGTVVLDLDGRFFDQPKRISVTCDFHRFEDGARRLADALIGEK